VPSRQQPADWRDISEELGARLRALREARDLTQEELAHRAGISRNQVQNIERSRNNTRLSAGRDVRGPGNPRLDTLFALALALDVEVVDLLPHALGGPTVPAARAVRHD
jgi:transcriptional regulator with XRE-family HTH domain